MMKRRIFDRLMGLILSATVILSCISPATYAEEVGTTSSESTTASTTLSETTTLSESTESSTEPTTETTNETTNETTTEPTTETTTEATTEAATKPVTTPDTNVNVKPAKPAQKVEIQSEFALEEQAVKDLTVTWEGNGTQQNPYLITSLKHFVLVQEKLNTADSNKYFKLTVDLDLSGLNTIAVEAGYSAAFDIFTNNTFGGMNGWLISDNPTDTSKFINLVGEKIDGTKPTISNLNLSHGAQNTLALFGYLSSNSVIDNINFENFDLTLTSSNALALSAFSLKNDGVITGCSFKDIKITMESNTTSNVSDPYTTETGSFTLYNGVGLVAADNGESGRIRNITAENVYLVIRGSRSYVGGIAAQNRGIIGGASAVTDSVEIKNLKITATSDNNYIGGVVGANLAGMPENKNSGVQNVDVIFAAEDSHSDFAAKNITGGNYVGGIAGSNASYIIQSAVVGNTANNVAATATNANIIFNGNNYIYGAISATNEGSIEGCSAIDVSAYHESGAGTVYGGIAGTSIGAITQSFSSGTTGTATTSDIAVGGIIGKVNSLDITVDNCYTLVKIANSTLSLGAVIGVGGRDTILDTTYWSSDASGRLASCSYTGAGVNDIELTRKLIAMHTGDSVEIDAADIECTWSNAVSISVAGSSFASMNNSIATVSLEQGKMTVASVGTADGGTKIKFNTTINLPKGVGSSHFSGTITQELYISVLVTSGTLTGDGLTLNTPIEIANLAQFKLIKFAPFAHYKLVADFAVPNTDWTSFDFTGTLDGNEKTLRTNTKIFNFIFGNIDENHTTDTPNRGYVHDLKIQLSSAITTAIFGGLSSAAFDNISLTGINGANTYTLTTSKINDAAFIGMVTGNSYINNCTVDVKVWAGADYSAGFIGLLDAEVTNISNCAAKSEVLQSPNVTGTGIIIKGCSPFIAQLENCTGLIKDCYSSGRLHLDTGSGIVFGASNDSSATFENTYWSMYDNKQSSTKNYGRGTVSGELIQWSFKTPDRLKSDMTTVTPLYINLPNLSAFDGAEIGDFEFSVTIYSNGTTKVAIVNDANHAPSLSSDGVLSVPVRAVTEDVDKSTVIVRHKPTGLTARATVTTKAGLIQDEDGVFLIQAPDDLIYWGDNYKLPEQGDPLRGEDKIFKLVADIDMSGLSHVPIGGQDPSDPSGTTRYPFNGVFTCDLDPQGKPLYSITNLKVDGSTLVTNNALFAYVGEGASITNLYLKNPVVAMADMDAENSAVVAAWVQGSAEFDNIWIENPQIDAGKNVGCLIGKAEPYDSGTTANISVKDIHVYATEGSDAYINADGVCVGGIVGISKFPTTVNNCEVTDLDINLAQYGVGGVVGAAHSNNVVVTNCTVTASDENVLKTISGSGGGAYNSTPGPGVGGIIGTLGINNTKTDENTGNLIDNCIVTGYKVECTKTNSGVSTATGGILGYGYGTVSDCSVINSEVIGNGAGGVVGYALDNQATLVIKDCEVQGTDIYSASTSASATIASGGILGAVYDAGNTVTVSHCYINETSMVGNESVTQGAGSAGGILGLINANATVSVSYCQVHSDVYSKSTSNGNGSGGIVGRMASSATVANTSISYCEVASAITAAVTGGTQVGHRKGEGGIVGNVLNANATATAGTPFIVGNTIRCTFSENTNYKGIVIGNAVNVKTLTATTDTTTIPDGIFSDNYYSSFVYNTVREKCELAQNPVGSLTAADIGNYASIATNLNYKDMPVFELDDKGNVVRDDSGTPVYKYDSEGNVLTAPNYRVDRTILPAYITDRTAVQVFSPGGGIDFPESSTRFTVDRSANAWASQTRSVMEVTSSMQNRYVTVRALRTGKTFVYAKFNKTVRDDVTRQTYTTYLYIAFPLEVSLDDDFSGAGTKDDPYLIYSAYDLDTIREERYLQSYFALANDIDMSILEEPYFLPIGKSAAINDPDQFFTGGLTSTEGNVFAITGLKLRSADAANLGLFYGLSGAELSNFIIDSPEVNGKNSVGALAGYATTSSSDNDDTIITNVTVRQPQISGEDGVGGLIGTAKSISNGSRVIIDGCTMTCTYASEFGDITATKNVGGILGKTVDSQFDVVIKNCTVNQMRVKSTTNSGSTSYFAGGIAADMNGIVENPTITNSEIAAMGAGGIVGTTSYNAENIKLTITGANVTNGTKIVATNTEPLTTVLTPAGGILAIMVNENATYTIKDCIVGTVGAYTPDVTVEGYSVSGGAIGSINSRVYGGTQTKQINATIDNIRTAANVKATRPFVSTDLHLYNAASLIGYIGTDFSCISLTDSVAGGIVEGKVRVGGLIGSINFTAANLANKAFASDCIITATLNIPQNDVNAKRGRVVADFVSGDGAPFKPDDVYTTYAFNNIYYSSYPQSLSQIANVGETIPKFGVSQLNNYTNGIDAKIYNLNNVVYSNGGEILDTITLSEGQEFVIDNSNEGVKIVSTQPTLAITEGGVLGFTATADSKDTVFEIASVAPAYDGYLSVSRDYGANTATIIANGALKGTVDLVFTYSNGLKISIPVKTNATEGTGTELDPFIINEPGDFDQFSTYEGQEVWFRQVCDIDMTGIENWQPKNFAGHYTGYDVESGKEVVRKITNLTINEPAIDIVGFFKTLSGSISNIDFEGIQVTGITNVGAIAGSATGVIENCRVISSADRNSSVTGAGEWYQSTSSGTGGLVGKTEGETLTLRISDCYIDENTEVKGPSSTAGILGVDFAVGGLIIERCESYAKVTSTGLTSSIGNAASILGYVGRTTVNNKTYNTDLNTIFIDNCVAGGAVKSSYNAAGVIASVNANSISWEAPGEGETKSALIQNTIVSAQMESDRSNYKAKIIGSCAEKAFSPATTGVQAAITGIYYSSYPQSLAFISNTALNNAVKENCTDVALYLGQDGNYTSSVKYSLNSDFSNSTETMVVDTVGQPVVLYVKNEYSEATIGKYAITINKFKPLNVPTGIDVKMELDPDFINNRKLTVQSDIKCTTDVEIYLSHGLMIRSAATFGSIEGEGTKTNPYKVKTTEDLNFMAGMYYTTDRYFEQVNDIVIDNDEDYASGKRYDTSEGGFRPIGNVEYKFNGYYDGKGYKVTNLYINRPNEENIGFFGYLGADAEIRNLHIELMLDGVLGKEKQFDDGYWNIAGGITGGVNVGGLAGSSEAKIIENCSVAYGNVNGNTNAAALVGSSVPALGGSSTIDSCFTTSTVHTQGNVAGGIVGEVNETLVIDNCFSTSFVYANGYYAGGMVGTTAYGSDVTINNSMFNGSVATTMGHRTSDEMANRAALFIGRSINSTLSVSSNLIGGTFVDVDFNKEKKNNSGEIQVYPIYVVAYVDALSEYTAATQNNYYDMSTLGKTISGVSKVVNTADDSDMEVATARTAEQLSVDTLPEGFSSDKWNVESGKYPYLTMRDDYSNAFSKVSSLHITPDKYDEENTDITRGFSSAPSIPNKLGSGSDVKKVLFTSTAWLKTVAADYDTTMDKGLYGNGVNGSERNTDVLFKDNETVTTLYKNSFGLNNTFSTQTGKANYLDGKTNTNGYEAYDARVPSIFATVDFVFDVDVDGDGVVDVGGDGKPMTVTMTVTREIKVPFNVPNTGRGGTNDSVTDYYVYTEYQLRELTKPNSSIYKDGNKGYAGHNIYIAADIELTGVNPDGGKMAYPTISTLYDTTMYGCNHTITGMEITANAGESDMGIGFIKRVGDGTNSVTIQDLTFEKLNISTTSNNVGGLAGYVDNNVTITNCVIGSSLTHTKKETQIINGEEKEVDVVYYDTKIKGGSTVGGLVGKAVGANTTITDCSSAIYVEGSNVVGGLVGDSKVRLIKNSSATGNVAGTITGVSTITRMGIGGFAGILDLANADSEEELSGLAFTGVGACFAAGNVDVTEINNAVLTGKRYGVGGFTGVAYTSDASKANACICISFSSGNVTVEGIENIKTGDNYIGVGGFAGINENNITNFYTSSAVHVNFDESASVDDDSSVVAAGGVVGVSWHKFQDTYTSGLIEFGAATSDKANCYIGGVLGYYVQGDELANSFYDSYKNNFEGLTPIGGNVEGGGISDNVKALTTDELCFDQYVDASKANFKFCATLSTNIWGADDSAYPYLKEFMAADVADKIRYPALLSVISVIYDERDTSVREGKGITMAITLPTEINDNPLNWETAPGSANYLRNGNKVVPIRTKNTEEVLLLGVSVVDKKEFAYKEYEILCADMLGTVGNPYLIGTPEDLQTIGLTPEQNIAKYGADSKNLHTKWVTQINTEEEVIQETANPQIHFKFMADVDMLNTGHTIGELNYNVAGIVPDKPVEGVEYNFTYKGLDINGFGFKLQNFKDTTPLATVFDAQSEMYDLIFENLDITSTQTTNVGIVAENRGELKGIAVYGNVSGANANNVGALAAVNKATISEVISEATVTGKTTTGGLVGLNDGGTITLSVVNADINGAGTLGGLVGANNGTIENSFSMGDAESTAASASVGGFVGINKANAKITACYSRTNITGKGNVAGFIGTNEAGGTITACYASGMIVNNALPDTQTCMFCASNSGNVNGAIVDKAMAGNSTYKLYEHGLLTEDVFNLSTFTQEQKDYYYINGNNYPQLKAIVDLVSMYDVVEDDTPVTDEPEGGEEGDGNENDGETGSDTGDESGKEPEVAAVVTEHNDYSLGIVNMLKAYSNLSSAALNTPYSQYIDSLPTNSTATIASDLSVLWSNKADAGVATFTTTELNLGNTPGNGVLTAAVDVPMVIAETTYKATLSFNYTTGTQNKNFTSGVGSAENPYQITTAEQLAALYYYGPDAEVNYKLAADIDMDTLKDTRFMNEDLTLRYPITELAGKLYGGYAIESLVINDNQLSLFGTVTGTIDNLGILDAKVEVTGGTADEPKLAGVLAQTVLGSVTNCYANADITATGDYITVGGLVGRTENGATLSGCVTTGKTMFSGTNSYIGGVVGYVDTENTVENCLSTTYIEVSGNDTVYAGGIAGYLANTSSMKAVSYASDLKDVNEATPSNIGLFIGGMSDTATLEDADYDKQLALTRTPVGSQGEAVVTGVSAMTTKAMQSNSREGWYDASGLYTSPISLNGESVKFARGLKFATTPITITIGVNAGTISNYKDIDFTNIDSVITMSPAEADLGFFKVTDGTTINASADPDFVYDEDSGIESAGLNITIDDTYVTRYAEFSLVRIVALDVVFNDTTGEIGNNQSLAALLKNKHGKKETSDVTTTNFMTSLATQSQTNLDDFAVSLAVNGFYVGAKLPQGYKFSVSAVDGGGNTLSCEMQEGEYGYFVQLESGEDVTVTIDIVKDNGWGVRAIWDSLIDAIVKSN